MFISLADATSALGDPSMSSEDVINLTSGIGDAMGKAMNRTFVQLAESVVADGANLTVTSYYHGFRIGQSVRVMTDNGQSELDISEAVILSDGFGKDTFKIACTVPSGNVGNYGSIYFAPYRTDFLRTFPTPHVSVMNFPVIDVTKVERRHDRYYSAGASPDEEGFETLDSQEYWVEGEDYAENVLGRIVLRWKLWPAGTMGQKYNARGARITYCYGGVMDPAIAFAFKNLLGNVKKRNASQDYQSESYDYYSYSKLSSGDIGALLGQYDNIIKQYSIPVQ